MVVSAEHLWQAVDAAGLLLAAWVWYQMFVAALAVSLPFQSKRTFGSEDLSGAEAAVFPRFSELMRQYYEASCQMFGSPSGEDAADFLQLDRSIGDASEESQQDEGCHVCQKTRETTSSGSTHGMSSEEMLEDQLSDSQVEAVIPETAPDAARDENEIHDEDPPAEKEDATDDERHDEKDEPDERDDAKDDRKDDPNENVDTVEQTNIASEYGVDAHSKGDMKHELNEEKETLDLHGNPEEETARELVDESSNDPKESEIVEAKEDPDAPHTDSTEHPSNEDPVERSSPSHRCDLDIPDLERMSISPRGSLGPEQQRVQKVQRDDRVPDPESKDWRPSLFRAAKSQARVKTRHSGTTSSRQGYSFYTTHERPRYG